MTTTTPRMSSKALYIIAEAAHYYESGYDLVSEWIEDDLQVARDTVRDLAEGRNPNAYVIFKLEEVQ